ncbi:MAG: Lrp/AsnC family transcriptional regulator [Burkholderiales bacterium]|nr:Lrp/AsnC family transcriptional regulator [Burkholderiales bacterium]
MLDKIDRDIIDLLRIDARMSFRELGERVYLSANTVADRVRRLQAENVLLGFHAEVNLAALDLPLQALVDIKMARETSAESFEAAIETIPGIIEATLMTGTYDYMLRVACHDQLDLMRLIEALRERAGVQDTFSRVILHNKRVQTPFLRPLPSITSKK